MIWNWGGNTRAANQNTYAHRSSRTYRLCQSNFVYSPDAQCFGRISAAAARFLEAKNSRPYKDSIRIQYLHLWFSGYFPTIKFRRNPTQQQAGLVSCIQHVPDVTRNIFDIKAIVTQFRSFFVEFLEFRNLQIRSKCQFSLKFLQKLQRFRGGLFCRFLLCADLVFLIPENPCRKCQSRPLANFNIKISAFWWPN
uniref:Uncharacterized protein n=1 Tax=Spironucleus salmonicida TaxID=348837 RepID=V6LST7_9EUKA|eukprot:EST47318.1 Hypothetical protein SS50377_12583 [Spironucleus salmonicida]